MLLARFAILRSWHSHPLYLRRIQSSVGWMRRLHSGKVGDYVAYFTFGVAGIGLALAALITW